MTGRKTDVGHKNKETLKEPTLSAVNAVLEGVTQKGSLTPAHKVIIITILLFTRQFSFLVDKKKKQLELTKNLENV